MPTVTIGLMAGLLVIPVVTWLLAPILVTQGSEYGYFLMWTLFASMGLTELAHLTLPLMTNEPYGYFPGMLTTLILAPAGWWGLFDLSALKPLFEIRTVAERISLPTWS